MDWFTSDLHLGHTNIIEYCNRPFKSIKEMDDSIIKNINETVDEDDTLFVIGDFCMKKSTEASDAPQKAFDYYRNQIKCKNIVFVFGNHDHNNGTCSKIRSVVLELSGYCIYLTHNPKFACDKFKFNFCGHHHGKFGKFINLKKSSVIVDLSVDNWNFRPVNINEVNHAYSVWLKSGKKNEKTN